MNLVKFIAVAVLVSAPALADTATTFTYVGTPTSTGYYENIEASFIVVGGNLQVTLYNYTPSLTYDKQILTGVAFTFSGAGSTAGTVTNPNVNLYTETDSNGTLTLAQSNVSANWITSTTDLSGYITLTNLGNNSGGSHGILSSTLGNPTNNLGQHSPYIKAGTSGVTFTIAGLGLTSSSQITGAQFNFGTGIGVWSPVVTGVSTLTPEPSTLTLSSLALAGLAFIIAKRKRAC